MRSIADDKANNYRTVNHEESRRTLNHEESLHGAWRWGSPGAMLEAGYQQEHVYACGVFYIITKLIT